MTRVEVRFDGVSRGAKAAAAETRGAIESVEKAAARSGQRASVFGRVLSSSLRAAASQALRLSALIGGIGGGGLAGAIAFTGIKFNDLKQRSTIAFETMLGSGKKARAFLGELQSFAAKTPFEFPELIKASQRLLALGFESKKVIPTLTAVGDAVAGMGGDPEALASTIRAIGQIQSKGRLMAEEMMQLNEAGTFSWQALAKEIGTSVPEAMELVSKGAVSADAFLAAFTRSSESRFKGMMDRQSRTFGGLLSTLKDNFAQLSGRIMEPFFELMTRGMQGLVDDEDRVNELGDRIAKTMRTKVVPALERIWDHFRDNWPKIKRFLSDSWEFGKDFAAVLGDVVRGADRVAGAIGGWDDAFKLILAGTITTKVSNLTKAFTGLAGAEAASGAATAGTGIAGAAAQGGRLLRTLRALGRIGAISIPITLFIYRKEVGEFFGGRGKPKVGQLRGVAADGKSPGLSVWDGTQWVDSDASGTIPSAGAVKSLVQGALGGKGPRRSTLTPGTEALLGVVGGTGALSGSVSGSTTGGRHAGFGTDFRSFHYSGQAVDLAADPQVWAALYARRWAFAELLGPWGLFNYGVQFFDKNLQDAHRNHIHVAFTGQPALIKKLFGMGVGATTTPAGTGATGGGTPPPPDVTDTGDTDKTPADPAERKRAVFGLRFVERRAGEIVSDQVRARIQKRVAMIREDLTKVVTDEQMGKVTSRVKALKDRIADVLKSQNERIREASKRMMEEVTGQIDRSRDTVGRATARVMDKVFRVFDAKTDELIRLAQAKTADLDARLAGETAEEAGLRRFREGLEAKRRAAERAEAEAIEDPVERARRLAELELADQERTLEAKAAASRRALEDEVATERERREKAAAEEQQRIADERELLRERFQMRLDEIIRAAENEEITWAEAQNRMLAVMGEYGVSFEEAGRLLGSSFATGFNEAIDSMTAAVRDLIGWLVYLASLTGQPITDVVEPANEPGLPLFNPRGGRPVGFQRGGKLPGRFLGREDTVLYRGTPGETLIDRRLTEALEAVFVHGRASVGGPSFGPVYVLGTTEDQVARALESMVRSVRVPSYTIKPRP